MNRRMNSKSASLINVLFFFSGFSCLLLEAGWSRLLVRALGAGSSANACVFAAFMAGAAIGALLAYRKPAILAEIGFAKGSGSIGAALLRAYGRLELLAGLTGFVVCLLLAHGFSALLSQLIGNFSANEFMESIVRFCCAFFLLLIPCSAMGGGLAAIIAGSRELNHSQKTSFPVLYGANTAGAALGCATGTFYLIPQLGLQLSVAIAACLAVVVFITAELLSKTINKTAEADNICSSSDARDIIQTSKSKHPWTAVSVALSGFVVLILELIWTRIFSVLLGASSYSLGVVLLTILLTCSASSFVVAKFKFIPRHRASSIAACFYLSGLCILLGLCAINLMQWLFMNISSYIAPIFTKDLFTRVLIARFILSSILLAPATFFLSAILPIAAFEEDTASDTSLNRESYLYSVNCWGSAIGSIVFATVLFPLLSSTMGNALQFSLHLMAAIVLLMSALIVITFREKESLRSELVSGAAVFGGLAISFLLANHLPEWNQKNLSSGALIYGNSSVDASVDTREIVDMRQGINSTVVLSKSPGSNSLSLSSDGKVESTLPIDPTIISPGSDISTHLMLGELPLLFHENESKDVFLIGLGSGVSASSILAFPALNNLTVAELEPAVVELCKKYLNAFNGGTFRKSKAEKLTVRTTDARFLLTSSNKKYDVIVSQPADPWVAGSGDLFTQEFWNLSKSRLNSKGLFCQWIQLYAIPKEDLLALLKTFHTVFPSAYIFHAPGAGELILLGSAQKDFVLEKFDRKKIETANNRIATALKANKLLASSGISSYYDAASLAERYNPDSGNVGEIPNSINSDDHPFVEFSTSKSVLTSDSQLQENSNLLNELLSPTRSTSKFSAADSHIHCEMARAYARLSRAESDLFKARARNLAALEAHAAKSLKTDNETLWTETLVKRTCFANDEGSWTNQSLPDAADPREVVPSEYWNVLAFFDSAFDSGNKIAIERAKNALDALSNNTAAVWLRRGMFELKFGSPNSAKNDFERALQLEPCSLPALLGSYYAFKRCDAAAIAKKRLDEYLSINPWDFASQLTCTNDLVLADDLKSASKHAESASQLRPFDASAYILLMNAQLKDANHWNITASIDKIKAASHWNPSLENITRSNKFQNPTSLEHDPQWVELVSRTIHQAEDQKNGYKMLGEP